MTLCLYGTGVLAEDTKPAAPSTNRNAPLSEERFQQMIPKHPGYLGALAPENLKKPRPAPPFDLTGT
ncbi:hypothetical protein, partial [Altererythrobacter fulvus]|uniref:hypothetical protein n=1 Tax=Caenibius fulvus TaxID=2126012 RepID=UPI00301A5CDD